MVNLHFSLLPRWRGAAPVERAILEGDAETGVCLMAVEAGLDTGGIYAEASTVIGEEETADELRSRLVAMGCRLLEVHLRDGFAGLPTPSRPGRRPVLRREDPPGRAGDPLGPTGGADPSADPAGPGLDHVPPTGGWASSGPRASDGASSTGHPGRLHGTDVTAGNGSSLRLVTVQPEGKRPMDAGDWLRGVRPGTDDRLGL